MKKRITHHFFLCALTALLVFGIEALAQSTTANRQVASFNGIQVSGAIEVRIEQGSKTAVRVTANADIIDRVVTEVSGNTLKVYLDESSSFFGKSSRGSIKVGIVSREIEHINVSGACQIELASTLNNQDFTLNLTGASSFNAPNRISSTRATVTLSGASTVNIAELLADRLNSSLEGASKLIIGGKVTDLSMNATGNSSLKGAELLSNRSKVSATGACSLAVHAKHELRANLSGASNLSYSGKPEVLDIKTSGASKIKSVL